MLGSQLFAQQIPFPPNFPAELQGEAGAMFAGVFLVVFAIAFLIAIAVSVAFCLMVYICFTRIPPEHRQMEPWQVWLLLIPCVNLVWNFFVYPNLAKSYQSYFQGHRALWVN